MAACRVRRRASSVPRPARPAVARGPTAWLPGRLSARQPAIRIRCWEERESSRTGELQTMGPAAPGEIWLGRHSRALLAAPAVVKPRGSADRERDLGYERGRKRRLGRARVGTKNGESRTTGKAKNHVYCATEDAENRERRLVAGGLRQFGKSNLIAWAWLVFPREHARDRLVWYNSPEFTHIHARNSIWIPTGLTALFRPSQAHPMTRISMRVWARQDGLPPPSELQEGNPPRCCCCYCCLSHQDTGRQARVWTCGSRIHVWVYLASCGCISPVASLPASSAPNAALATRYSHPACR
jgi:hypothetical protein